MSETLYACTFDSPTERRIGHVRAWDPSDAIELFVLELRSEGIVEAGEIAVVPLHGGGASTTAFRPRSPAAID